jgi:hypothetical protein
MYGNRWSSAQTHGTTHSRCGTECLHSRYRRSSLRPLLGTKVACMCSRKRTVSPCNGARLARRAFVRPIYQKLVPVSTMRYTHPRASEASGDRPSRRYCMLNCHDSPKKDCVHMHHCTAAGKHRNAVRSRLRVCNDLAALMSRGTLDTVRAYHQPFPRAGSPVSGIARCIIAECILSQTIPMAAGAPASSHSLAAKVKAKPAEMSSATPAVTIRDPVHPRTDKARRINDG